MQTQYVDGVHRTPFSNQEASRQPDVGSTPKGSSISQVKAELLTIHPDRPVAGVIDGLPSLF
jgi:hypothetical protein